MTEPAATRVLIAEDDSLLRELFEVTLRPHFPALVTVANGQQAIEYLQTHLVDVLVTDWLMPGIDGLELIRRVRAESSEPPFIIMNTVLGSPEARAHALSSGADDFLAKPSRLADVRAAIEHAALRHHSSSRLPKARPVFSPPVAPRVAGALPPHVVVAIAVSTGGPATLAELFAEPSLPPSAVYLVALHGPEWLHQSVVESLRRISRLSFALAEDAALARPGTVYFACKDRHLGLAGSRLEFDASPPEHFLRPAADPMLRSVARGFGRYAVAVVLTGMGQDGAAGCAAVAAAGGTVLAQDPATAVIGSMPKAVIDSGLASAVFPLSALGRGIARHVDTLHEGLVRRRSTLLAS